MAHWLRRKLGDALCEDVLRVALQRRRRVGWILVGLRFTGVRCVSLDDVSGATECARRPIN